MFAACALRPETVEAGGLVPRSAIQARLVPAAGSNNGWEDLDGAVEAILRHLQADV